MTFWDALSGPERDALLSVGRQRTFAGGSVLIQEGEQADHVIIILGGWTKICLHQDGRERIIAERGPGQLVGERAALQVSVRSASVIALDTVRALAMSTEDFADFIGAHPHILEIVEAQVYDRLTEPEGGGAYETPSVNLTRRV
jgi:CRP-like cAMP-binding protein